MNNEPSGGATGGRASAYANAVLAILGMLCVSVGVGFYDWRAGLIALGTLLIIDSHLRG
jgi:hypothetical protein